ncbi:MAG TPA: hypothetical protein VNP90_04615 [Actinomycetota bacterium]|nr:hypothetical protein [Actinomycetota bacterium]
MAAGTVCTRCDEDGTTVVIEFSAVVAYLDLCERHLADLLRGARPADDLVTGDLDFGSEP